MSFFEEYLEQTGEIGYINSFFHSIAIVSGLPYLRLEEMIFTESGKMGIVYGLRREGAEVLMLNAQEIKIGERVTRTAKRFEVGISDGLLGRIVDPILRPIDDLGPISTEKEYREINTLAPGIIERRPIRLSLETGVTIVDLLVPIAYGQRELIIGDSKTGKTTFLLQAIANQAKKGLVCIYVSIGKKDVALKWVEDYLKKQGVSKNVVIIHTTPDDSPTLIFLSPYSGMTVAEYFRDKGKNVLIVLDDLTTHAKIWREISLLLKRAPGRDSYPGDIFHVHATLLERAGVVERSGREISITALPVAETLENDLSGFIQTNLMAMTDGHIFFDINEFRKGKRPAINIFLSVSRVGNQTKTQVEKDIANWIRKKMIEYRDIVELTQFGAELLPETQKIIEIGQKIELLLNQSEKTLIPRQMQILLFGLLISGFWDLKSVKDTKKEIEKLINNYQLGKIKMFRERVEEIKNLDHLLFLIREILPKIETILRK